MLAERDQILTEGIANLSRLIFGGPFTSGLRARLFCNWRELIQRILIVVEPNREVAERESVTITDAALPVTRHGADLIRILDQGVGIFRSLGRIGRHIYAARVHHRGIDQPVDAFDVPAAGVSGFEFFCESRMKARVRYGEDRQRDGRRGHQCEDCV